MSELRVIIAGGRDFDNYELLEEQVVDIVGKEKLPDEEVIVVSGNCRGADQLGEVWAARNKLKIKQFPADWENLGKRAGYVRNDQMAKFVRADGNRGILIAFWDGESRGTKHMIDLAMKQCLKVYVIGY